MNVATLNIKNTKRKENKRHMQKRRRKGTPSPSMTPQDPKVEKGRKDISVPTAIEDSIQNPHA